MNIACARKRWYMCSLPPFLSLSLSRSPSPSVSFSSCTTIIAMIHYMPLMYYTQQFIHTCRQLMTKPFICLWNYTCPQRTTTAHMRYMHVVHSSQIINFHFHFVQLILTYYNMIPDLVTTPAQSHDHVAMPTGDKGPSFQQMLSSAIRVSLSGETEEGVLDDGNSSEMRGEAGSLETLDLQVPDELPVDMRVKLAICLIHRALPLPHSLLSPITSHPEEYGDLFIDLAEAYAETGRQTLEFLTISTICIHVSQVLHPRPFLFLPLLSTHHHTTKLQCG